MVPADTMAVPSHLRLRKIARGMGALLILSAFLLAILTRPAKWLSDFDQSFYLTIAYDISHHGVFSNGVFDDVNSTVAVPPPGMFFAPVYPWLIVFASKVDPRFARALDCSVEVNQNKRDVGECETYARPIHIMHAVFLTAGVLAIAAAAELILVSTPVFWPAASIALIALLPETNLFSFTMTESVTFSLYCIAALLLMRALRRRSMLSAVFAGAMLGCLCLTRISFLMLLPISIGIVVAHSLWMRQRLTRHALHMAALIGLAWALVVGPWAARNIISVGKWGLTEEYGSAALIERFAFDDLRLSEFFLAFPYCLPGIGEAAVNWAVGPDAIQRFDYRSPNSFFRAGRAQRVRLRGQYGQLDPVIGNIALEEFRDRGWKYVLSAIPLAWCGMWVGGMFALLLVPCFALTCIMARGQERILLLLYSFPAVTMLVLHAAVANHYTRYNLVLLAPFSIGAAWIVAHLRSWWNSTGLPFGMASPHMDDKLT